MKENKHSIHERPEKNKHGIHGRPLGKQRTVIMTGHREKYSGKGQRERTVLMTVQRKRSTVLMTVQRERRTGLMTVHRESKDSSRDSPVRKQAQFS